MKLTILDPTLRQRFLQYYQQNDDIPQLYFVVKYNNESYFNGLQSSKQIYGTTAKYLFIVPRAFANYPVTKVEVYELDSDGNISVTPSIILDYQDEYIYDGADQIVEFELMLTDLGNYVSAVDMFLLTHIVQSLYFRDDLVSKMLSNNASEIGHFYVDISDVTVSKPGEFSYKTGVMVKGYTKDYAYIYNRDTGEIYLI